VRRGWPERWLVVAAILFGAYCLGLVLVHVLSVLGL
jgi:hypothetical protein